MKRVTILLAVLGLTASCGHKDEVNLNPPPPGGTPILPGTVPPPSPNEVVVTIVDAAVLSDFAKWPLNNPTNVKAKISLNDLGAPSSGAATRYGGSLSISFQDSGYYVSSPFTTGGSQSDAIYNYWIVKDGKSIFRAFFEDQGRPMKKVSGGLVLVIDESNDIGDGSMDPTASGSIWFLNFEDSYAPQTDKKCWFVSLGPYDCRAFLDGSSINMGIRIFPETRTLSTGFQPGYKKLGTFTNLNLLEVFNQ